MNGNHQMSINMILKKNKVAILFEIFSKVSNFFNHLSQKKKYPDNKLLKKI